MSDFLNINSPKLGLKNYVLFSKNCSSWDITKNKNAHRFYMKSELGDFLYSRYLKNYNGFKKSMATFLSYTKDYLLATKLRTCLLGLELIKISILSSKGALFSVTLNISVQNIWHQTNVCPVYQTV